MRITIIGRGNVVVALARLWQDAGHQVATPGRSGGDAEALVEALPRQANSESLGQVTGLNRHVTIDATNTDLPAALTAIAGDDQQPGATLGRLTMSAASGVA